MLGFFTPANIEGSYMKKFRALLVLAVVGGCVAVRIPVTARSGGSFVTIGLSTNLVQQASQPITLTGLRDRVTIRRDERGIPYIEATNDEDLYFAQGYITASDRLWQMDLLRRTVRGELSEIFGNTVLGQDKTHRVFGFAGILDEAVTHLPANLSVATKAYADGVNAFIDSRTDQNLPPEFLILQYKPRHWTPADSLAVGKLLAEYLSSSWQLDVMRASMANLSKEKREALLPETSPLDVLVVGSDRASSKTASRDVKQTLPASFVPDQQVLAQLNDLIDD